MRAAGSLADHEPGAGRWYPGLAIRYSNSFGAWDAGVYQFHGLAREPSFGLALDAAGAPVLAPFYEIVNQTGADMQYTAGAWLWKLEALLRQGQRNRRGAEENYAAAVGGFEYTVWAVLETGADLGLLVGAIRDLSDGTSLFTLEASRRIGDRYKLTVEARLFSDVHAQQYPRRLPRRRHDPGGIWVLLLKTPAPRPAVAAPRLESAPDSARPSRPP